MMNAAGQNWLLQTDNGYCNHLVIMEQKSNLKKKKKHLAKLQKLNSSQPVNETKVKALPVAYSNEAIF